MESFQRMFDNETRFAEALREIQRLACGPLDTGTAARIRAVCDDALAEPADDLVERRIERLAATLRNDCRIRLKEKDSPQLRALAKRYGLALELILSNDGESTGYVKVGAPARNPA